MLPTTGTSCTLLDRARARDDGAWQRLVTLYAPLVRHWCRRAGVSPEEVQDVAQEVFFSVSASLPVFQSRGAGSFRGWVRGIVRHKALDHFRRSRGEPVAAGGTEAHDLLRGLPEREEREEREEQDEPGADAAEVDGLYRRALDLVRGQFEDRTWRAFWRSAVDGYPADVVAAELAMTPVAVRIAKSRVLARLRKDLGELIL